MILNDDNFQVEYSNRPFNIIISGKDIAEGKIKPEEAPNFIIRKNNEVKFAVVNGFLLDIEKVDELEWQLNNL